MTIYEYFLSVLKYQASVEKIYVDDVMRVKI